MEKKTKVFILGAGCSADCRYPLGTQFVGELERFLGTIPHDCQTIRKSVDVTLDQFKSHPDAETIDQLTACIDRDDRGPMAKEIIIDAKVATVAMFLHKETEARASRLQKYENFITQILGGGPFSTALGKANCRVLSFNYDRLFEIAFMKHFPDFHPTETALYDKTVLNSCFFSYGEYHLDPNDHDGFCFLKLHGSVGWWGTRQRGGGRQYCLTVPERSLSLEEIEAAIPKPTQQIQPFDWQPFIAFPRERQASQDYEANNGKSSDYHWAPYIDRIWKRAARLLADAAEVRVIGYSFHPIDSRPVVEKLLTKARCEKIVIQNKVDVLRNLDSYQELQGRLAYDPIPFGE